MKNNVTKSKATLARKRIVAELIALNPDIKTVDICKKLNISSVTLSTYRTDPDVIDMIYDRFMEVAGIHLPQVLMAQIEEAKRGNTRAAELILKHFGKLQDTLVLKVESPFMQHLKVNEINQDNFADAEFSVVTDEPIELPPRNHENDRPIARTTYENKKVDYLKKDVPRYKKYLRNKQTRKKLVDRAKVVGLKPLPPGRPTEAARRKWMNELIRLEKNNTK